MWIRSQNKAFLVDVDNIYIEKSSEAVDGKVTNGYFIRYDSRRYTFLMGIYSTEEKAKKVLDMIQRKIIGNEKAKIYNNSEFLTAVYQMPKDYEVEDNESN